MRFRNCLTARQGLALALAVAAPAKVLAASYTWKHTGNGGTYNWNDSSGNNWTPAGAFPNAAGDVATLAPFNQTINLNQSITVGTLNIQTDNATTLAPGSSGTLY